MARDFTAEAARGSGERYTRDMRAPMGACTTTSLPFREAADTQMADTFFSITNTVALLAWVALVLFPGRRAVSHLLCGIVVPAVLAAGYAAVIGWKLSQDGPPPGDLSTIGGLKAMFADDWVFAAAWAHYLVFDMVVGAWIARDAVRLAIPWPLRTVCLVLTFLLGPVGFLLHVVTRVTLRRAVATDDGPATPTP